ncbi:hypothetical protein ACFLKB_17100 [Clostridium sp. FAM 1755]|uniref:Uncharacterized protein n=2 Tax=Clostridium TaxID=1485 RepID=A0A6M0T024_CLOBO|nr:hypothetical protein [Clostridium sporogenes]NFA60535.1 hypothetical protein [Clostridium botulinum]MDS1004047.1 hypothetical protein [Clostridium sporogenes]NFI73937.1 hypothetical protein [Clostridium sporogenes]NFL73037.1 hypothetical protein [Clostridium sporogenes]NFM23788.1 hypothetical protein [Clostridium sporogenes]
MSYNIFETVVKGSNTVFLDIPSEEYFSYYDRLNKKSADNIVNDYLINKGSKKDAEVMDVGYNEYTKSIQILAKLKS